jgi:Ni,Fe-hydrogenase III component G
MNHTEMALNLAAQIVAPWAKETQSAEPNRLDATIEGDALPSVVEALQRARWGYLAAITGLDLGSAAGRIELLYHFCEGSAILTLRLQTPYEAAVVPSLCVWIPSAAFFERELEEMLGVTVAGAPSHTPLFLPDDWPPGVYPLRKSFPSPSQGEGLGERVVSPSPSQGEGLGERV